MLEIRTVVCGAYEENAYLVWEKDNDCAVVIDPGDDVDAVRRAVSASGKKLGAILLTHGHFDHILAAEPLQKEFGCPVYVHEKDMGMLNDRVKCLYNDMVSRLPAPTAIRATTYEKTLPVCGLSFYVLHTPGHTPGSVSLYLGGDDVLFSGDTLFFAGFGRTDFPGSSTRDMRSSLFSLFELPAATRVYCGHGPATTIGTERARYGK